MTPPLSTVSAEREEVALDGRLWEFREALRDELEAARRASASGAVQLVSGRRIAQIGGGFQYLFLVESALNIPDDSPGDLHVRGQKPVETTVISVEGLAVTLSVPVDFGEFVPRASLQSDLTHLLRKLIERIEALRDRPSPAGDRLLGEVAPSGEPVAIDATGLNAEQAAAVASSLGRDTTFIWGPPGTGKTRMIGRIGAELVHRGRSLLLVSHTNAAVDQAILKIADELGAELVDGTVLRLGDPADPALRERTRLLASTHIDERGAALAEEREQLTAERAEREARVLEVQRLVALWDWLPVAEEDANRARATLANVLHLERERDQAAEALRQLRLEAETVLALGEAANKALAGEQRLKEARATLARNEPALTAARDEEASARQQLEAAEAMLAEAEQHGAETDTAAARLVQLRPQLEQERTAAASDAETLAAAANALVEAEALLERALEVSGLVRRWRGLPKPEEQQALVADLRDRREQASSALDERRGHVAQLEGELRDAEAVVAAWGHLPAIVEQRALVKRLRTGAAEAATRRSNLEASVQRARQVLGGLGDPRGAFEAEYGQSPETAGESAAALEQRLRRSRENLAAARSVAADLRETLEAELETRLAALREWSLTTLRGADAEAALDEIDGARKHAQEIVAGSDPAALRAEAQEVNTRIRAIDARLNAIEDELQRVEELVVGDAWVVATTLTRAYKRDSVQKRRFNTVILDEASMAPIPALWAAASIADGNVVLVGDFRQLPPIKHAETPLAEKWLGTDIFELSGVKTDYEANEPPAFFVPLHEQFRMHPQISAIPNRFLYRQELRDASGVENDGDRLEGWFEHEWGQDTPVLLVDTGSLNAWVTSVNNAGRTSRLNFLSATVCVDLAEMLLRPDRPEPTGGHARILIGAPYRPQVKLLTLLLREQQLDHDVRAGTAHTFQGSEAPVMIFDLVNDEPHWKVAMFMQSRNDDFKRLLNVALTRAQRRLIIVGDFDYIAKQGKKAFVHELIDFLRARYSVVDAASLIPTGLSARAARIQLRVQGGQEEPGLKRIVVTQDSFDRHLFPDLAEARERVVIFSPFLTYGRVATVQHQLRAAIERGARVWVVTKGHAERGQQLDTYRQIERTLQSWGVTVVHKAKMHEKLVFVDDETLWHGSLNVLSFSDTQEIMERRRSRAVVEDYEKTLRLPELLAAYDAHEAGEATCPYCETGEIVASEGRDDPFYWRCVNKDCFTRSIDDPMPKDGMVVCTSAGCGLPVHFGYWGDKPHWRCEANPRHRTRITKSHLRLPKMRALIPPRELKKLDRQFSLDSAPDDGRLFQ